MRTYIVIDMIEKSNDLTLDTCFIIQAYKNPEIALNELEHNGFDKAKVVLKIKKLFGKVIVKGVTTEERTFGLQLEKIRSILYSGGSAILVFVKRTSSTLVTLDKNLEKFYKFFNVNCIFFQIIQTDGVKF